MDAFHNSPAVQEIQGLDGAFTFPELTLQRIWGRGELDDAGARTLAGEGVRVLHPGRWNRLGGPDFRQARLRLGDREVTGDVELHLQAADWEAHGHHLDPAYGGVVLHAVLFPPPRPVAHRRVDGTLLPVLVLLPLLRRGLEEYAEEEAVENLARRPGVAGLEELLALLPAERSARLREHAQRRWRLKVHHAGLRIGCLGWGEACHQTALEILGYRFNRGPMLRIAGRYPLCCWTAPGFGPAEPFASEAGRWIQQGVRPANRPRERLRQYAAWTARQPDWPIRLEALAPRLMAAGSGPAPARRWPVASWRLDLAAATGSDCVGGSRLDNLIADGFLPLLAARTGWEGFGLWSAWPTGDMPGWMGDMARLSAEEGEKPCPKTQGFSQGVLGWLIERERRSRL
jgi:hypothetical protein